MPRRTGVQRARRVLLLGTALIVVGRLIVAALIGIKLPDRTIVDSWVVAAESGELGRLGIFAAIAAVVSALVAVLGYLWLRRPVERAVAVRRWAIVVLTLSLVFLVMSLLLPWGMVLTAGPNPDVLRPDPFAGLLAPALAIPTLLLSGVVLGVRAIAVTVLSDVQRNRRGDDGDRV